MPNKAAIDFGNSNTVVAVWDDQLRQSDVLSIPEFSRGETFLIPSLIAYEPDGRSFIGGQVPAKASPESKLFRWMKRYINLRSPYSMRVGDQRIDACQAAEDFLRTLTAAVFSMKDERPDELVISVPVESFEHYSEWLLSGMKRFENMHIRLVDEASAAAAGYGMSLHPGDTLLVVDFGGSTLQAVCVSVIEEASSDGRSCRVLGKAGCNLGGMTLDRWIYEKALQCLGFSENDSRVRNASGALLTYCERFKKILSENEVAVFDFFPDRSFPLSRTELVRFFAEKGLFDRIDEIVEEAIRTAEDHGLVRDELTAVLPVGGSCLIPSVIDHLTHFFSTEKVMWGEPLGAVARGAAVIAGGMHIYDFIQHDYAIRYTDPVTGNYAFHTIIQKGVGYPERHITPKMRLKTIYEGQTRFGIAIYELREGTTHQPSECNEIFFDADGAVHVMPLTASEIDTEKLFWVNERSPLFLQTDDPGERGIPRFEVDFGIDSNRMLTINVMDLHRQCMIMSDHPVIYLV